LNSKRTNNRNSNLVLLDMEELMT